jgi:hypothetical protein
LFAQLAIARVDVRLSFRDQWGRHTLSFQLSVARRFIVPYIRKASLRLH